MDKVSYHPEDFETRIYQQWLDDKAFEPQGDGAAFVIVIPPPNVTGVLHMGHGLNIALQDVLVRFHKMQGRPTLWLPGTDHAGIATQHVVEKKLLASGTKREELSRAEFLEHAWKVKEEHHSFISKQLRRMGAACDWGRERFTLDEGLSEAVRYTFVELYKRSLIYRGRYLINWCTQCRTALADDEVEHQHHQTKIYTLHYPLLDGSKGVYVSTTRPETLFGDTAVAVHPQDQRYQQLVGERLRLPLSERSLVLITDSFCDPEFGTGAVKITPAHDPNDWQVAQRHQLEKLNILCENGTLNENVPPKFQGLKVLEARKKVLAELEKEGYLVETKEHTHQVGHCYRCATVIEPYLSSQWFVKMQPLAEKALQSRVKFHPEHWHNTYRYWLENIRDWCISRQLWWGHRIPAWYCQEGHLTVAIQQPECCSQCASTELKQEEDVLDTWFSSWLWAFSTFGWPQKTADLKRFYPTSTLVTGYDILFFWVARMIMAGQQFLDTEPFEHVYLTPLVRDKKGRKMSKSLGNGIDPLKIVDSYGADALKFTLVYLSNQGQDILLDEETFQLGSRFCNKVWNALRFTLMQLEKFELPNRETLVPNSWDCWIETRIDCCLQMLDQAVKNYRFDDMGHAVYNYFWNEFCDWYLEALKAYLQEPQEAAQRAGYLCLVVEKTLRLLHPFVSFLSEELYQKLPLSYRQHELLYQSPAVKPSALIFLEEEAMVELQQTISTARTLRSQFALAPSKKFRVEIVVQNEKFLSFFKDQRAVITKLVNALELNIIQTREDNLKNKEQWICARGKSYELRLAIRELIDVQAERQRLKQQIDKLKRLLKQSHAKLENTNFLKKAPLEVVEAEKKLFVEQQQKKAACEAFLLQLSEQENA